MIAPAYTYRAQLIRVIDGDTVEMAIDMGFKRYSHEILRLAGINAPEVVGEGRAAGLRATDALANKLRGRVDIALGMPALHKDPPPELIVETFKDRKEKYGRYLAVIWADGQNINDWLVEQGHAVRSPQ